MVNIKVAVRIRPLSHRELLQGEEIVVRKENKSIVVVNPKIPERQDGDSRQRSRRFSVDFCYDPQDPEGCSQEAVYKEIGSEVLDSILEGYNACVLAYGHSASGKTYTIMGLQDDPGLTPRLCEGLFQKAAQKFCDERIRVQVAASFLEIYNEKVKDLLGSEETGAVSSNFSLRVREHPKLGPYVQGLSEHLVTDRRALLDLLTTGNRKRSTAATENNRQSSRSHAVFTIHFRQSDGDKCETEKWSKVHLVDLAGSERATSAQSKARLQEGANINKSLVTLGYVISALAESLETSAVPKEHPACKSWQPFVPYRDSVLTWLLKDTLGGNSNTIMIATISPASGCLSETVNTLRYAKKTKRIVNEAVVNEDPKVRTIRELRKEIARLKGLLVSFQSVTEEGYNQSEIWRRWVTEGVSRSETMKGGERRREGEGLGGRGSTKSVRSHSAASSREPAAEVNDEKESVVNGSTNDSFSHESEIFSDSLESLGSVFVKKGISCEAENEAPVGAGRAEVRCCENLKRMHRSRPDLIKGISGHLKERPPSTSSQSCAEVSNLSQSTSENSVTSSGSMEVQSSESRGGKEKMVPLSEEDWRSEVVDAVTTRLYLTKKKPEQWGRAIEKKENANEVEELKLCKRARMKLFDLRRKLGMTRRMKRTVDSDTQTDCLTGTVRVKEKCVETDPGGSIDDETDGGLDESFRDPSRRYFKTTGGRFPETTNCAVDSETQTAREEKSDKSANTSPTEFSPRDEECFSDDSLESDHKRGCAKVEGKESHNLGGRCRSGMGRHVSCLRGEDGKREVKAEEAGEYVFEELPPEYTGFLYDVVHASDGRLVSRREENLSSDSSFTSAEGTEIVSSSEASSEDFVFYENPKEDSRVKMTATRDRELYTITENSEQSDPGDAISPVQSQNYFVEEVEGDGTGCKWSQNRERQLGGNGKQGDRKDAESEEESEGAWKGEEHMGKAKKMKWSDWQSNCERQYLNLNVSSSSRAPFSIDTHLFGKEWRKEQSTDALFTSADSVTLVLMGPAKPKSSVLMEIIRRSLARNSLSGEAQPSHRKSKNRGVQCDENLVRSVSVDMAMIALSRIARNQELSPNIVRAISLGTLDPDGIDTVPAEGKGNGSRETIRQYHVDPNCFSTDKKKSALKCSPVTEMMSNHLTGNDVRLRKKWQDTERQKKKSVSWSGETTHDVEMGSRSSKKGGDKFEAALHQSQPAHEGMLPTRTIEPTHTDSKTCSFKPESSQVTLTAAALHPTDDLTAFLKEAIYLLRKINSASNETAKEVEVDAHIDPREKRTDKVEFLTPDKTDKWSEKESNEGRLNGVGALGGENSLNSTWPRRRGMTGKPPTGMKGRFGRSGIGGRSESLHCSGLVDCTRNCRWSPSKASAAIPPRNWCAEEVEKRAQSCGLPYGDEDKWDNDVIAAGMSPPRMSAGKANLESVLGAERGLEKCCRRLELAAERDELREILLESRKVTQFHEKCDGYEAGILGERWQIRDEWGNSRKVRKGMKRRKGAICSGGCSCTASPRDPCKHFLRKGCQSSFELDSFGPGSKHCHQMCMFCRKKDAEQYSSALNLNSECLSDVCRLNYYGYCPCSSVRLSHVASSPRAYMQHLLTLRRQIVGRTKVEQLDLRPLRDQPFSCFSPRHRHSIHLPARRPLPPKQRIRRTLASNCGTSSLATVFCKHEMPLPNKCHPRKISRRKNATAIAFSEKSGEDSSPFGSIALNLGNIKTNFENGQWIPQSGLWDETSRENVFLKTQINQLAESSSLLKLKNDILLDMLAEEFLRWHGSFYATSEDNFFCCDLKRKAEGYSAVVRFSRDWLHLRRKVQRTETEEFFFYGVFVWVCGGAEPYMEQKS